MSTATATRTAPGGTAPRSTLPRVMRSEWTKLMSLRSTFWTLLALMAITVGLGALIDFLYNHNYDSVSARNRAVFDPTSFSLQWLALGQLAIAVLGVLIISSEYSTGGIRTTFTAVPNRMRLLSAKTLVFALVALVVGLITSFAAFGLGQLIFAARGLGASLSEPSVLRAVIGGGLYVGVSGLFGLACGLLLRHSAAAITAAVALLLVVPPITLAIPGSIGQAVQRYFTSNAGSEILAVHQTRTNYLTPWVGFLVFCAWVAVPLLVGAYLMKRRDA